MGVLRSGLELHHPALLPCIGGCKPCSGHTLAVTGPLDGFYLHIKVAFVVGIVVTSPVWLYQIWAFVAPGLYAREKRWTYLFIGTAVPLFLLGSYLSLLVMGRGLHFLIGMVPKNTVAFFTADTYISYFMMMLLGFGLCFELPLFLVMLNQVGILPHDRFKKWRRVLIFCVFVFAGIASPSPDPITMLLLGGACVVLVEAAEVVVLLNDRRRARLHPAILTLAWPTTSFPRSSSTMKKPAAGLPGRRRAERCSTCLSPSCWSLR